MPIALPGLCFVLVFYTLLRRRPPGAEVREAVLTAAVVWGVLVTGITELLSALNALTPRVLAASWAAAVAGAGLLAALPAARRQELGLRTFEPPRLAKLVMGPPIAALVLGTGLITLAGWPSQTDSMIYRLSRIDHWVQNESITFYPTHIVRQLFNPPWSEFAMLHLTALGEDERWANAVQWFSMLGSLVGVSLIAKHLGAGPRGQLFSALFCATIPMGILQASGTQNDYVTAFWLVCTAQGLLSPSRPPTCTWQALRGGASVGLALLTKGTALVFAPPLLVTLVPSASMWRWAHVRRGVLVASVALLLNASHFARNLETFGSPFGPRNLGSPREVGDSLANDALSPGILASNLVRNLSLHLGSPSPAANRVLEHAIDRIHAGLGLDVNDPRSTRLYSLSRFEIVATGADPDRTGNPVHLVLIFAAVMTIAVSGRMRRSRGPGRYLLALLLGLVLFSLLLKWQPWHSRLHLPLFVLASPLVGVASEMWRGLSLAVAVLISALAAWPLLQNRLAPLVGEHTVLNTPRVHQYFRSFGGYADPGQLAYVGAAEFLRSRACADVGLVLGWDDWEHPLWVLLAAGRVDRSRIEHVAVTNSSAGLENRRPVFAPCAVVVGSPPVGETIELGGLSYRVAWSGGELKVFLPANTATGSNPRSRISTSKAAATVR